MSYIHGSNYTWRQLSCCQYYRYLVICPTAPARRGSSPLESDRVSRRGPWSDVFLAHGCVGWIGILRGQNQGGKKGPFSQPAKTECWLRRWRSPDGTEAYADGRHTSQALSGDVNRGAATVGKT